MGKSIYTTKFGQKDTILKKQNLICHGLDEPFKYKHSKLVGAELNQRENYFIYGNRYLYEGCGQDLAGLNDRVNSAKLEQAKFILFETAKLTNKTDYVINYLKSHGSLTGDVFRNLFSQIAYTNENGQLKPIDEKAINEIFEMSEDVEPHITYENPRYIDEDEELEYSYEDKQKDLEEYIEKVKKEDEELIAFNEDPTNNEYYNEVDEIARTNAIRALGFNQKDIDKSLNAIKESKDPDKQIVTEFKKLISDHMDKIPSSEKNEDKFIVESEKLYTIFRNYGKHYLGDNPMTTIKDYIKTPEYKDFAISNTDERGLASTLNTFKENYLELHRRSNRLEEEQFNRLTNAMKHVQQIHEKRSLFSRFIDWFDPKGEYRTIKSCTNMLKKNGYSEEEINEAVENASGSMKDEAILSLDDHINSYSMDKDFLTASAIGIFTEVDKNLSNINCEEKNLNAINSINDKYQLNSPKYEMINEESSAVEENEEPTNSNNVFVITGIENDVKTNTLDDDDDYEIEDDNEYIEPQINDEF